MKKFMAGFLTGVVATVLFFLLGGAELMVHYLGKGSSTVEKEMKKSGDAVKEKIQDIKK